MDKLVETIDQCKDEIKELKNKIYFLEKQRDKLQDACNYHLEHRRSAERKLRCCLEFLNNLNIVLKDKYSTISLLLMDLPSDTISKS